MADTARNRGKAGSVAVEETLRHRAGNHGVEAVSAPTSTPARALSRRAFVAGTTGLGALALGALVAPSLLIGGPQASWASEDASGSADGLAEASAVADAGTSTLTAAERAAAIDWDSGAYYYDLSCMVNEIPMGTTVALNNEDDPNGDLVQARLEQEIAASSLTMDEATQGGAIGLASVNKGLDWYGTMEVTVTSATLYQGSFNIDEDLARMNLGYFVKGMPTLAQGEGFDYTQWRILVAGMTMHNVDAVTHVQHDVADDPDPDQKVSADGLTEDVLKDFDIGSWRLVADAQSDPAGTVASNAEVATFNGTKDDPGPTELYHYRIEPGETREFLLGWWVAADVDFGGLYLSVGVGGQLPNGNFFKLDVTPANEVAVAGTNLE